MRDQVYYVEFLSRPFPSRTVSNCQPKLKTPAAARALLKSDDMEMGGGDTGGDGGDESADNSGIVAECQEPNALTAWPLPF